MCWGREWRGGVVIMWIFCKPVNLTFFVCACMNEYIVSTARIVHGSSMEYIYIYIDL